MALACRNDFPTGPHSIVHLMISQSDGRVEFWGHIMHRPFNAPLVWFFHYKAKRHILVGVIEIFLSNLYVQLSFSFTT